MLSNEQIASAILSSRTIEDAAKKLNTSPSVIYERKRKSQELQELLDNANKQVLENTVLQLLNLNSEALAVLGNSLHSESERFRLTSALKILQLSQHYYTALELTDKVRVLEDELKGRETA